MNKNDAKKVEEEVIEEAAAEEVVDQTQQQIENLENQVEETEQKYKRALADYQNLQKRAHEDRAEWIRSANKELLLRILTVFDTLVLAYQHLADKNLEVSINQFLDVLKAEGAERIEAVGKEFDPEVMEAITTAEGEEGKVVTEVRAGFLLNGKLLRAAQVTVGSAKQN